MVRFSPDLNKLRNKLLDFINDELLPYEVENNIDPESNFPFEAIQWVRNRSIENGFYGISLPQDLGGQNISLKGLCMLKEELARSGTSFWGHVLGEMGGVLRVGDMLNSFSPEQKDKYVIPLAHGKLSCCFALTEPGAGSDVLAMATMAIRDGNDYIINGKKDLISAATYSDFAIVMAKDLDSRITAFIVDRKSPKTSGYEIGKIQIPISGDPHTGELIFKNCRVPASNIIGEPGSGLHLGLKRINKNRATWGATYIGTAQCILDLSVVYAQERKQFGKPIGSYQAIQHMLADMATEIYAGRCMLYDAIEKLDSGEEGRIEASMVKLFTSETANRVADKAVQIFGGRGLIKGHPIERLYRTVRIFRIGTGTSEIQRNTIAKQLQKKGLPF